jgi:hypothetical protein
MVSSRDKPGIKCSMIAPSVCAILSCGAFDKLARIVCNQLNGHKLNGHLRIVLELGELKDPMFVNLTREEKTHRTGQFVVDWSVLTRKVHNLY